MCAQAAEAHAGGAAGTLLPRFGARPSTRSSRSTAGRCKFVLRFQTITLLVAVATLALTDLSVHTSSPKASFPIQDTGVIQGISEAAQTVSFPAMSQRAAAAGEDHPEGSGGREPVVVHRHRRHQHHAEQRAHSDQSEAARRAQDQRQRCDPPAAAGAGQGRRHHAVHAAGAGSDGRRPRQPHAVPVHARRSQAGRVEHLRAADAGEAASSCRSCATWRAISRCRACRRSWCSTATPRRASASRRRPSIRRCTTPTASAQVSTMFTQLNQYHVVLEVKPEFRAAIRSICAICSSVRARDRRHRAGVVSGGLRRPPARSRTVQLPQLRRPAAARRLPDPAPQRASAAPRRPSTAYSRTAARCR